MGKDWMGYLQNNRDVQRKSAETKLHVMVRIEVSCASNVGILDTCKNEPFVVFCNKGNNLVAENAKPKTANK